MRRYWVDSENIGDGVVELNGEDFHHICIVCRQGQGDKFEVLTEGHRAYFVEITSASKKSAQAKILEERKVAERPKPHIHLCLSIPRPARLSEIIEKAVEMGVEEVHLFVSEHSYFRDVKSVPGATLERLKKVVRSATQQSGRGDLMKLAEISTLKEKWQRINQEDGNLCLMAYEGNGPQPAQEVLAEMARLNARNIFVFIGSEGGFSQQEAEDLHRQGCRWITLGEQILRVETACVVLPAILKYQLDHMR